MNAEAILELLAKLRQSIPYDLTPQPPQSDGRAIQTVPDFELAAVATGLQQLTAELTNALERAHAKALAGALEVYYAAEELARDPANAHLIPHVQTMRDAFQRDYGVPIPPRS